jgi:hypothetical protein
MRATVLLGYALAALGDCSARPAQDCVRPSPGARRLLIEASDLGPQARKLLPNLESDPFVYFRFINRPWSRATCAALGAELASLPHVHLHGDAHVGQYAYTLTDHGLDDLDDSISGPPALDLVRFLGSVDLAARARGWTDQRETLFDEFFRGYRAALVDRDYKPPVPSHVWRMRERLRTLPTGESEFLAWAESLMEPVEAVDDRAIEEGRRRLAELVASGRPELPAHYLEPKRVGWLRMGVGSALTPKLLLRCEGRTRADEDDVLLEARELSDLRMVSCVDVAQSDRAVRIIEGYGRVGRIRHDIIVEVPGPPAPEPGAREWWARSWEPSYRELRLDDLASPEELAEIVHDAAAQLGTGHAWTPEDDPGEALRAQKLEWLESMEPRMRAVARHLVEDLLEAWEIFRARSSAPWPRPARPSGPAADSATRPGWASP